MYTKPSSDTGHHNCRDYHLPIPIGISTSTTASILSARAAQKSPLNQPTKHLSPFPFLNLPCELRRQIYNYLLPYTGTHHASAPLPNRSGKSNSDPKSAKDNVLWHRGQTSLLCVNRQLWRECSSLLYGDNIFVLLVTYDTISFPFRWLLPSGLAPSKTYDFLALLGDTNYLHLIKRLVVTVDHVDSYRGMIKYNVGGKGLTHGLKLQVQKLVRALNQHSERRSKDGLKKLTLTLLNGNDVLDAEKRNLPRSMESSIGSTEHVQTVLEPLAELTNLVEVAIQGAVTHDFEEELKTKMMSTKRNHNT